MNGKISRSLGILYKARKVFNRNTLATLYNSFIHPLFSYCICVWGNSPMCYLDPIVKLQKRAIRVVAGAKFRANTAPLFKELNIMNVNNIYVYNVLIIMYKHHHGKIPDIFQPFFVRNNEIHDHATRQQSYLHVNKQMSVRSAKSFRNTGVKIYNYFKTFVKFDIGVSTFKTQVKKYIIDKDISFLIAR